MARRATMSYDAPAAYAALIEPRYTPIARALIEAAELRSSDQVLELGAGTGLVTKLAAPHVSALLATDLTAEMLDVARRATRRHPQVRFVLVDYNKPLPFLDASFEVALSGLTYVQDSGKAVREVARVLKPRGRIALTMWGPAYHELALLSDALEAIGRPRIPAPSAARAIQRLKRAGFGRVERQDFDFSTRFSSIDEYIDYRRGFGRPAGASEALYTRYIGSVRRRAERDADGHGRLDVGWTLTVVTARR